MVQVKLSRETRNANLIKYLNALLSDASGRVYFKDAGSAAGFVPLSVPVVADWALNNANLLEPSSLGRPHFSKYLSKASRGVGRTRLLSSALRTWHLCWTSSPARVRSCRWSAFATT